MSTQDLLPISVDGTRYLLDWRGFRRQTMDSIRELVDQGVEAGEQTFTNQGLFKRSGENFIHGARQEWYDPIEDSDRKRFNTSHGFDPWTPRALKVGKLCELAYNATTPTEAPILLGVPSGLCHISDHLMRIVNDGQASWTSGVNYNDVDTTPSGDIVTATTDGFTIWFSDDSDVYTLDVTDSTVSVFGSPTSYGCSLLRYVKGRLLAANGNSTPSKVWELDSNGDKVVGSEWTHPAGDFRWKEAIGAPNAIYAVGSVNPNAGSAPSEIYMITIDETTGTFAVPIQVGVLPQGEQVLSMVYYGGIIVMGTTIGLRCAVIDSSGFIQYGPVIEIDGGVKAMSGWGNFVYFGYSDSDRGGVMRADLSRFIDDLVPAIAVDATLTSLANDSIETVVAFENNVYFCEANADAYRSRDGVWAESAEFRSGRVTYGTPEQKRFYELELRIEEIDGDNAAIAAGVYDDTGAQRVALSGIVTPGVHRGAIAGSPEGEWAEVYIEYGEGVGDTATTQAEISRWTLYSIPLPDRNEELYLPLVLHDQVTPDRHGITVSQDAFAKFQLLYNLVQTKDVFTVLLGDETITAYADQLYIAGQDDATKIRDWRQDRSWFEATWILKCIALESSFPVEGNQNPPN